jgi:hypothetical protein
VVNTYTSYQLITRDIDRSIDQVERQPVTKRETEYYLANITKAKSIEDFLGDDRLFKYAMKAFGLKDMDYAKAFMKKVLTEGIEDPDSFANSLSDKRYLEFATTFDFEGFGSTATVFNRAQQGTVDKYLRQTLEEDAGKQNEGVRLALYFERKAPTLTSYYQVLADPALAQVMRTALGLPDSFASADIDKQVALFESRIDIADLKDPEKLSKFMQRFTSLWEISNPTSSAQTSVSVLFGQPAELGISTDLMMAMQKMRF